MFSFPQLYRGMGFSPSHKALLYCKITFCNHSIESGLRCSTIGKGRQEKLVIHWCLLPLIFSYIYWIGFILDCCEIKFLTHLIISSTLHQNLACCSLDCIRLILIIYYGLLDYFKERKAIM